MRKNNPKSHSFFALQKCLFLPKKIHFFEFPDFFLEHAKNGEIPKYGVPEKIIIVDEISKTSVGKINKKELRRNFK